MWHTFDHDVIVIGVKSLPLKHPDPRRSRSFRSMVTCPKTCKEVIDLGGAVALSLPKKSCCDTCHCKYWKSDALATPRLLQLRGKSMDEFRQRVPLPCRQSSRQFNVLDLAQQNKAPNSGELVGKTGSFQTGCFRLPERVFPIFLVYVLDSASTRCSGRNTGFQKT